LQKEQIEARDIQAAVQQLTQRQATEKEHHEQLRQTIEAAKKAIDQQRQSKLV
jgi:hypothetical protein